MYRLDDQLLGSSRLRAWRFDVAVVAIEFIPVVSSCGGGKDDADAPRSDDLEEGVISQCAVVIEGFVWDVPSIALTGPVGGFVCHMLDECCSQVFLGPGVGGDCF